MGRGADLVKGHNGVVDVRSGPLDYNDGAAGVRLRIARDRDQLLTGAKGIDLDPRAARKLALRLLVKADEAEGV